MPLSRPWLLLLGFGLLSLACVLTGAWICAESGVAAAWRMNLAAWAIGGVVAVAMTLARGALPLGPILWLVPIGLAATFLSRDQEGVHRWIDLGPVHLNAAMVLLPSAAVAFALRHRDAYALVLALSALALLVLQPDASQATAWGIVIAVVYAFRLRTDRRLATITIAGALGLTVMAWFRPDPLRPVPEVEEVIRLGFIHAPAAGALALALLAAVAAAPVVAARSSALRPAGFALAALFVAWSAAPFLGAFPVPFVGIGMSPIIGGWLGVGLLAGRLRAET